MYLLSYYHESSEEPEVKAVSLYEFKLEDYAQEQQSKLYRDFPYTYQSVLNWTRRKSGHRLANVNTTTDDHWVIERVRVV